MLTHICLPATLLLIAVAASAGNLPGADWEQTLQQRLPLYGHRNWIVIADSAYPAQSRDGIETIVSNADHFDVLQKVLAAIGASKHVAPIIYTDKELGFVREENAPGVSAYREHLAKMLEGRTVNTLPHMDIIRKLDETAQTFRVLIIKTTLTIPYTSVFLQLDCAYWGPDAERRLRTDMREAGER
ncbi:MAG TPA: RbsD/FucU domain-containing protein [Bryobacteraceae bacterium]|nr:RbsD/FucU domain-containing protein [Bryobacteraceae bacterium]